MQYELRQFDQLISGSLSPLLATTDKQQLWQDYLQQQSNPMIKQFALIGQVDTNGNFRIQTTKVRLLPHQSTIPWADIAVGRVAFTDRLVEQVLPQLNIQHSEVQQTLYWEDERGIHLELFVQQDVNRLTSEEVRFNFYLCYLEEHTQTVKQKLTDTVCKLSSDKKARKYVQNHQSILIGHCMSVMQHLNEEDRQHIYCVSDGLTTTDIYKMIFQALEDIIAHLEQHFTQYLDVRAYVPYRSRIISFGQMVKKFVAIQQVLQRSSISSELLATLEKPFERIENLKTEQTTYAELLYFKKFIQELGCLVERDSVSDYHVAETLFRINFNRPAFLAWLMSRLDYYVADTDTVSDKLETLYGYRKLSKQLSSKIRQAYQPGLPDLDGQIRQYIDEDIQRYRQQLSATEESPETVAFSPEESTSSDTERIPTLMTVVQLAHFLRLLFEAKAFPKGHKRAMFRWFARMVSTPRTDQLSAASLYDRQYEADDETRTAVQDLLQKMMNLSRKRKS